MTFTQQQASELATTLDYLYDASTRLHAFMQITEECGPAWKDAYVMSQAIGAAITQAQQMRVRDAAAAAAAAVDAGACTCDCTFPAPVTLTPAGIAALTVADAQ